MSTLFLIFSFVVSTSMFSSKNSIFLENKQSHEIESWEKESNLEYSHLEFFLNEKNCESTNKTRIACLNSLINILKIWNFTLDTDGNIIKLNNDLFYENELLANFKDSSIKFSVWKKFIEIKKIIPLEMEKIAIAKGINGFLSIDKDPHSRITLSSIENFSESNKNKNVESVQKGNNLYIKIRNFNEGICSDLKKIVNKKINKIIIDLRENPGGLVSESVCAATIFTGPNFVINLEYFNGKTIPVYGNSEIQYDKQIDILVDSGTASAAELFSGFLQLKGKANIIGEKTYGKGTFQEPIFFNEIFELTYFKNDPLIIYMKTQGFFSFENYSCPQIIGIDPDIETISGNTLDREKDIYLYPLIRKDPGLFSYKNFSP